MESTLAQSTRVINIKGIEMGERTEIFECDVCLASGPFTLNGHTCDIQWMTDEIPAQRAKIKELVALVANAGSEMKLVESNANEWVKVKDERIAELEAIYRSANEDLDTAWQRIAALEALLRTTVDLLSDTDSLVLEQLTIDIACILPVQGSDQH